MPAKPEPEKTEDQEKLEPVAPEEKKDVSHGLFGAALLYGDGTVPPAISVLSAIEGLEVATKFIIPYVVPVTIVILFLLFLVQRNGTKVIGTFFGPVMVVCFITIGILGFYNIIYKPEIIKAINPLHAVNFFGANGWPGFIIL